MAGTFSDAQFPKDVWNNMLEVWQYLKRNHATQEVEKSASADLFGICLNAVDVSGVMQGLSTAGFSPFNLKRKGFEMRVAKTSGGAARRENGTRVWSLLRLCLALVWIKVGGIGGAAISLVDLYRFQRKFAFGNCVCVCVCTEGGGRFWTML